MAKEHGVKLWQVADYLGIGDTTLCRRLRKELSEERKREIIEAISKLSTGGGR